MWFGVLTLGGRVGLNLHGRWEHAKFTVFMARRRLTPLDTILDESGGIDESDEVKPVRRRSKFDIYSD